MMVGFFKNYWIQVLIISIIGYLLGSVNFSIIVTSKIQKAADIRSLGSGNAGFTNVLRSVGKEAAIITFLGDISKASLAIFLSRAIFMLTDSKILPEFFVYQYGAYVAGIFCVIGHIYPCFFKFKGGKGLLTLFSMIFFIDLRTFFILLGVFLTLLLFTKIVSLCSIVVALLYPAVTFIIEFFFDRSIGETKLFINYLIVTTIISTLMSVLVIYKHKSNIKRLLNGEEKKISAKH